MHTRLATLSTLACKKVSSLFKLHVVLDTQKFYHIRISLLCQLDSSLWMYCNVSIGSFIPCKRYQGFMLKNAREIEGPSTFSIAKGMSKSWQAC